MAGGVALTDRYKVGVTFEHEETDLEDLPEPSRLRRAWWALTEALWDAWDWLVDLLNGETP